MVTLGLVLSKHGMGSTIGNVFSCGPIASLCTPFLMGYFVDRYFSAERVMTVLHIAGSVLLTCMPHFIETGNSNAFFVTLFVYNLCFVPTLSLMNNIAFGHVENAESMPYIRLFANVGWIAPGFVLGALGLSDSSSIFSLAAASSLSLGVISFSLPPRPPAPSAQFESKVGTLQHLLVMLRDRSFVVLLVGMVLISVPMSFYYAYTSTFADAVGFSNVGSTLAAGQLSELVAIALIPFLIKRVGHKWMIFAGMMSWVVRYTLFSIGATPANQPIVFIGIAIHGICYDFMFVTAFIFAEKWLMTAQRRKRKVSSYSVLTVLTNCWARRSAGASITSFFPNTHLASLLRCGSSSGSTQLGLP